MTNKEKFFEKMRNIPNEELARILSIGFDCKECLIQDYCRTHTDSKYCEETILIYLNEDEEEQNDK